MATRPYISYLTKDLVALFEKHPNDKKILIELKKELVHRNRPKAVKLLERVEVRLAELKNGARTLEQLTLPIQPEPKQQKLLPPLTIQATLPGIELPEPSLEDKELCPTSSKSPKLSSNPPDEKDCISATSPKQPLNRTKILDFLLKIFKRK